jgi:hypothetical protein
MRRTQSFFFASLLLNAGFLLGAQEYAVDWHAIPGGGGTSSGGSYSLSGSIGQAAAGGSMTGGTYALTGGFWSLIAVVPTPGAPPLSISRAGGQLIISWPTPTVNWTLQQNASLANAAGWTASSYPVATNNGVSSITISAPAGNWFFRLAQP